MRWTFPWAPPGDGDFNYDFAVSFREADMAAGTAAYTYAPKQGPMTDLPGVSAFVRDDGAVCHTYSASSASPAAFDILNTAYNLLDLTTLGGHEEGCRTLRAGCTTNTPSERARSWSPRITPSRATPARRRFRPIGRRGWRGR